MTDEQWENVYKSEATWKRNWLVYTAEYEYQVNETHTGKVTRKLDFLAYHLIRYFHGDKKLHEMANEKPTKFYMYRNEAK